MESIMDILGLAWRGDSVERLSSQIHETQDATRKGLESAVPLSMAGLASLFSSEQEAGELLGSFKRGEFPHVDANEIGSLVSDPAATTQLARSGKGFLARVFGTRLDTVLEALAGQTGVSRSSANTLLGLSAPLVIGAVEREAEARHLDAKGLSKFLSEEGRKASGLLPGALSNVLGKVTRDSEFGSLGRKLLHSEPPMDATPYVTPAIVPPAIRPPPLPAEMRRLEEARREAELDTTPTIPVAPPRGPTRGRRERRSEPRNPTPAQTTVEPARRGGLRWLWLPLALFALFALFRMGSSEPRRSAQPATISVPNAAPARSVPSQAPALGRSEQSIPNGETEPVVAPPAPATEAVTVRSEPDVRTVYFDSSSAQLHGRAVLRGVAATLVAHPDAHVTVRGYADAHAEQATEQGLSEARAGAVKDYLVAHGVSAERITTSARGSDDALASDSKSRRVELLIEH